MVPTITLSGTIGSGHRRGIPAAFQTVRVPLEPWHQLDRDVLGVMVSVVSKHGLVRYVRSSHHDANVHDLGYLLELGIENSPSFPGTWSRMDSFRKGTRIAKGLSLCLVCCKVCCTAVSNAMLSGI